MQKHSKTRNVPFPRPCGATGNDAQKLHAYVFAHFRGAVLMHEVLYPKSGGFSNESTRSRQSITGANFERPDFNRMMEAVRAGLAVTHFNATATKMLLSTMWPAPMIFHFQIC